MTRFISRDRLRKLTASVLASIVLATAIAVRPGTSAYGFLPLRIMTTLLAPGSLAHTEITERAVKRLDKEYFPDRVKITLIESTESIHLTRAMSDALNSIENANAGVDLDKKSYVQSANHFDGENFVGAQKRLVTLKQQVIDNLNSNNILDARVSLGMALHTLQDFYSHSNWVELGNTTINTNLGNPAIPGSALSTVTRQTPTCTDCTRDTCDQCLNNLTTQLLTTGYYNTDIDAKKPAGVSKCNHGGLVGTSLYKDGRGQIGDGINKDSVDCTISPHHTRHREAADLAIEATYVYIRSITELVGLEKTSLLLGGGQTLAVAIDTTGSMGNILNHVKQQITQVVDSRLNTPEAPARYVLVPFNDPAVGPPFITTDPAAFKNALNALTANGGGDCPEPAMKAILNALSNTYGGQLYVFTDADAKDRELAGAVTELAERHDVKIYPFVFGSCTSGFDPTYLRIAEQAGGQLFTPNLLQAEDAVRIVDALARSNSVHLFDVRDTLGAGGLKNYTVPVDPSVSRLTFTLSSAANGLTVVRPDGTAVLSGDPGVDVGFLNFGMFVTVNEPTAGEWSFVVNNNGGGGNYSVQVTGDSFLRLTSFDFVTPSAGGGHPGYLSTDGRPLANEQTKIAAGISSHVGTAQFQFRDAQGGLIQSFSFDGMESADEEEDSLAYFGDVVVPSTPFSVYVVGEDADGHAYQRLHPGLIEPQYVKIAAPDSKYLRPGKETKYTFQVTNYGPKDTFRIFTDEDRGFLKSVSEVAVVLDTNQTRPVTVTLEPPPGTEVGVMDTLLISVKSTKPSGASNTASLTSTVAALTLELGTVTTAAEAGGYTLSVGVHNAGGAAISGVGSTLTTSTPGVTINSADSSYPDLSPAADGVNETPFAFTDIETNGRPIGFTLTVGAEGYDEPTYMDFTVQTSEYVPPPSSNCPYGWFNARPAPIPVGNAGGMDIPIKVSGMTGELQDLNFKIGGSSCSTDPDSETVGVSNVISSLLTFTLTSPQGTTITLLDRINSTGSNFCNTTLDDEGGDNSIQQPGTPGPLSGTYKPLDPLAVFKGEDPNGTWVLHAKDWNVSGGGGRVRAFSLSFSASQCAAPLQLRANGQILFEKYQYDGSEITGTDIYVMNADGSGQTGLTNAEGYELDPAWSPDGSKIAYAADGGSTEGEKLYLVNADGDGLTKLTTDAGAYLQPIWSPDGSKVVFERTYQIFYGGGFPHTETYSGIGVVNSDGSNEVTLTEIQQGTDTNARWSPDGMKIAFERQESGASSIYVMDATGINQTNLTGSLSASKPEWSPYGDKIAFQAVADNGISQIFVMNSDGSGMVALTNRSASVSSPSCSPDGTKIVFEDYQDQSDGTSEVYVVAMDGSLTRITNNQGFEVTPRWSPDGNSIIYAGGESSNGVYDLQVYSFTTGSNINLTPDTGAESSPVWKALIP